MVLSLSPFGEGHREALLLTSDQGLVRAAVFGGAKSKLRSLVSPWHSGSVWIYTDPVKKANRITDFDVRFWREGIRENLVRSWCASLCAEVVTRSHGIAEWTLINAFLDGIAVSSENECKRALLRFIWRVLMGAGIHPETSVCARCLSGGENAPNEILFYAPGEEACLCQRCARTEERQFPLSAQALDWLKAVETLTPAQARSVLPDSETYAQLRKFLFFLLARMVDGKLRTLESGEGII